VKIQVTQSCPFEFAPLETIATRHPDAYVARISADFANSGELFGCLKVVLRLPDYFGMNWDALDECLGDLTWISARDVVLAHEGVPQSMDVKELQMYLRVLADAVRWWERRKNREHTLSVVFPRADEFKVRGLLGPAGDLNK